jgi:hypothetical protein
MPFKHREVDHEPVVAHGVARNLVPASPHGDGQAARTGEAQRRDEVGRARAPDDDGGMPVD